jgi:hypothetical protein
MADIQVSRIAGNVHVGDDIKEVLRNDRQAWAVICALVLTISVPASMISKSNFNPNNHYNNEVAYLFITSISVSTTTSILVIWNSTYSYLKINQLEKHKLSEYLFQISKKKESNPLFLLTNSTTLLANLSFLSIAILFVSATYLFNGAIFFWISMPIIMIGIISVIYNEYSIQTIYNNINVPKMTETEKIERIKMERKQRQELEDNNRLNQLMIELDIKKIPNICYGCSMCKDSRTPPSSRPCTPVVYYPENCNRLGKLKEIYEEQNECIYNIIALEKVEKESERDIKICINCLGSNDLSKYNDFELEKLEYTHNIKSELRNSKKKIIKLEMEKENYLEKNL